MSDTKADRVPSPAVISHPAPVVDRVLRCIEGAPLPPRSRILSLGSESSGLVVALRVREHDVLELRSEAGGDALRDLALVSPGRFDCVVAVGHLERQRWDRWALQQIHRLLKDGGLLLLAVPDLYSPLSLADPRYLAAKLAKRFLGRIRAPGPVSMPGDARQGGRTYAADRLRMTLTELGYAVERWSSLAATTARPFAGLVSWIPTHHLVLARRRPGSPTTLPTDSQADAAGDRRRFESANRSFLEIRDAWCRRHAIGPMRPGPLELGRLAGSRILVLAPHPDDEIIGCGGTLLQLVRAGAKVTILQATDGSASVALDDAPPAMRRTVRLEEAQAVAEAAGFEPTIFWREDNAAFGFRDDLVARLRTTLEELSPTLVFTPFVTDIHPDHRTLNRILAAALEGLTAPGLRVLGYEVWALVPANLWCDVSSRMEDVARLLQLYDTAMKVDDFVHMCSTRNRHHALTLTGRPGFAEAYFSTEPALFRDIVATMPTSGGSPPSGPVLPSSPVP